MEEDFVKFRVHIFCIESDVIVQLELRSVRAWWWYVSIIVADIDLGRCGSSGFLDNCSACCLCEKTLALLFRKTLEGVLVGGGEVTEVGDFSEEGIVSTLWWCNCRCYSYSCVVVL